MQNQQWLELSVTGLFNGTGMPAGLIPVVAPSNTTTYDDPRISS